MSATTTMLKGAISLALKRGSALTKRAMMEGHEGHMGDGFTMMMDEDGKQPIQIQMPGMFWLALFAVLVVFAPILLFNTYTLNHLVPTLAMIEDPAPPAYEPLGANADDDEENSTTRKADSATAPVTSSLRLTLRTLRSISGFSSLFRGFWCAVFAFMALGMAEGFFAAFIPGEILSSLIAPLPALLVTLPLTTAWTHIVMSAPRPVRWYRRLPPVRTTFTALWRPALIMWVALAIFNGFPALLVKILGIADETMSQDPSYAAIAWKSAIVVVVNIVLGVCVVVPAHIVFARCQASLLPLEDEPIVFFDRSFSGAIAPEIVGGRGYATVTVAWKTFSKAAWMRLIKLYVKIIAFSVAIGMVFAAVLVPIVIVGRKHATVIPGDGN